MRPETTKLSLMILITICIGMQFSCNNNTSGPIENAFQRTPPFTSMAFALEINRKAILWSDTTEILGVTYFAYYLDTDSFVIINQDKDTVFADNELYPAFEFEDFDKDGYDDIIVHYMSNTPSVQDLILFDVTSISFRRVENFSSYPEPIKILNTKYYYSYHRSGCADMNWDSDLFYIKDFKTVRIGNISGRQCNDRDVKDGIYIHKVQGDKETIYTSLPIEILGNYKDYKWGFIKEYWTLNYTKFI